MLPFEPAGTGPQGGNRKGRGVVDKNLGFLKRVRRLHDFLKIRSTHLAAAYEVRADAGFFGKNTCRQLLARHFEGIETDNGPIDNDFIAELVDLGLVGLGRVEGDIRGEGGLAHRGAPREDDQIRWVQPAEHIVQIGKAGSDPCQLAVPLVGGFGNMDCLCQDRRKVAKAPLIIADRREIVEPLFGAFDLACGSIVHILGIGFVYRVLAQPDQLSA